MLTAIIAWLSGVESLPSVATWLGAAIVCLGTGVLMYFEKVRMQDEADAKSREKVETLAPLAPTSSIPSTTTSSSSDEGKTANDRDGATDSLLVDSTSRA